MTKRNVRKWILKGFGFSLVMSAFSSAVFATQAVPEMDPGLATSALALLGGGLAMVAGRSRPR
jgi:hypothetical protein